MKIGIFTIIKNEHKYLDEWLQYHLSLGIDSIFVFDDVLSESHKSICEKYNNVIHNSILSIYPEKEHCKIIQNKTDRTALLGYQTMFMRDCLCFLQTNTDLDWVFYIDSDEFITLNVNTTIHSLLYNYNKYDVLVVSWKNYNASGHIFSMSNSSCIDTYTTTCQLFVGKTMAPNASCKMVFNLHTYNKHTMNTTVHIPKKGCRYCKTNFSEDLYVPVYDMLYLRHYITKSFEEYCEKIFVRGQFQGSKLLNYFFIWNPDITKNNPDVISILNSYGNRIISGELPFYIF